MQNRVAELAAWEPSLVTGEHYDAAGEDVAEVVSHIVAGHSDDLLRECMECEGLTLAEAVNQLSVVTEYDHDPCGPMRVILSVWRLADDECLARRTLNLDFH